ncbi:MAG TPA: hypothetical protein VKD72_15035 [Gemmataceae bacterium]|nr:hypothetical protein [Gemmataceae bacterium]
MTGKGRLILGAIVTVLALLATSEPAWAADKNKMVRITNKQNAPAEVYINFAAVSVLKPTDLPFCKVTGSLNCQFTLAANASQDVPNPQAKYLNMALAFNAPVNCGSTKAEVLVNNPNWYDVLDVSVVDGFNEKIQINLTPTGGNTTQLGPPVGKLGNQKVFGVFPYGCTICAGIKDAPCGDAGAGECKKGSESNPDVLCQYQMNEPTGLVEVLLQPK